MKYVANAEFLKLMNLDANKKVEQGFTVYMQATRIAAGDKIENTFVENFNGNDLVSNTVVTNTPKPPAPQEDNPPAEPTPEPTPEPNTPPAPNKQEWHTGANGNGSTTLGYGALGIAGAAVFAAGVGTVVVKSRRKRKASAAETTDSE